MSKTMKKSAFRVIAAGPWDPETFSVVDAEVVSEEDGLEARVQERGGPLISFEVDGFEWRGDLVVFQTNAARKWILRALP